VLILHDPATGYPKKAVCTISGYTARCQWDEYQRHHTLKHTQAHLQRSEDRLSRRIARVTMTSVPYLSGKLHRNPSREFAPDGGDDVVDTFQHLKASLPTELLKVRHIRAILITHLFDEAYALDQQDRNNGPSFGDGKAQTQVTFDMDDPVAKVTSMTHIDDPSLKKCQHEHKSIVLRKGKSTVSLKTLSTDKMKAATTVVSSASRSRDDTCVKSQKNKSLYTSNGETNTLIGKPEEIRRQIEQQKLNDRSLFKCFYTINHFMEVDNPYFISRTFPPHTTIEDELDLRIHANSATINLFIKHETRPWQLLRQYHLKLSLMINLGDDLSYIISKLSHINNLPLLKMSDGCYYTFPYDQIGKEIIRDLRSRFFNSVIRRLEKPFSTQMSCSFDQIMTMNNYSRCIHDLLSTKRVLTERISALTKKNSFREKEQAYTKLTIATEQLKLFHTEKCERNYQTKEYITKLTRKREKLRLNNKAYEQHIMSTDLYVQKQTRHFEKQIINSEYLIKQEKARIALIVEYIFPVTEVKGKPFFSLFSVNFPNSLIPVCCLSEDVQLTSIIPYRTISSTTIQKLTQLPKSQAERLNAIIGYISLIVMKVAEILRYPLRYPMKFLGSNTYICDPITHLFNSEVGETSMMGKQSSHSKSSKQVEIYPLFICQNATLLIKFTYALFLLRKNIEQLYEAEGIVKIEEFNLLTACKIWLTCVEGCSDLPRPGSEDEEEDTEAIADEEAMRTPTDANAQENFMLDLQHEQPIDITTSVSSVPKSPIATEMQMNDISSSPEEQRDSLSPLLMATLEGSISNRRISSASRRSKLSNISVASNVSQQSAISQQSTFSMDSNVNSIVSEYNKRVLSDERIRHIKEHLLKGMNKNVYSKSSKYNNV
jgi:hypothetical protein